MVHYFLTCGLPWNVASLSRTPGRSGRLRAFGKYRRQHNSDDNDSQYWLWISSRRLSAGRAGDLPCRQLIYRPTPPNYWTSPYSNGTARTGNKSKGIRMRMRREFATGNGTEKTPAWFSNGENIASENGQNWRSKVKMFALRTNY